MICKYNGWVRPTIFQGMVRLTEHSKIDELIYPIRLWPWRMTIF
jgi:hypothetical protein